MKLFRYTLLLLTLSLTADTVITVIGDCPVKQYGNNFRFIGNCATTMVGANANASPVANTINVSVAEGETATLDGSSSTDSDGTIATWEWTQIRGEIVSITNADTSIATFPSPTHNQILVFTLTVTDNDGAQSRSMLRVTTLAPLANSPPNAATAADFNADEQTSVNLVGTSSTDSDGTIDAYSWVQTSGPAVTINNDTTSTANFTAPDIGSDTIFTFQLVVTDNDSSSDSDVISITINPTENAPYEIAREASRTSGTAPLSVFFTAGFSTSSPTVRDFHDLEYSWDFDDPTSGTWGTSGKSKDSAKGGVASHLFESAGTYTVALTVKNAGGTVDTDTFVITVTAADTTFSTTNTTCLTSVSENDFTGCPSGATQVATDDLDVMTSYDGAGKRILLDRGSSWTQPNALALATGDTFQLGAYGTCTSPDSQGICSNAPLITATGTETIFSGNNKVDWRITDITLTAATTVPGFLESTTHIKQFLVLRVKTTGFDNPISLSHFRFSDATEFTETSIISSNVREASGGLIYIGGEKISYMGNIFFDSEGSHVVRVWAAYQGVITHNQMSGASHGNSLGKHALKFHGPLESWIGTYAETGDSGVPYRSQFTIISNNLFGTSGPWTVSIGPQNGQSDERLSDIIIEKNKVLASYGTQNPTPVQVGLMFEGRYITARNNVLDGTGGEDGYLGIYVARRGIEATPVGNRVYNNTIYRNGSTPWGATGIKVGSSASDTIIRNNFVSFPETNGKTLIEDLSNNAINTNNLLTNAAGFVDPNHATPESRDFSLLLNSPAINQGTTVPVLDDFNNATRAIIYELGAYQY